MTDQEILNRADEAERLMANPIFREAVDKTRNGLVSAMEQAAMGDEKTHNRLVIALQLLNKIEKNIKEVADTGKLTKIQLEEKRRFGFFR